MKEIILKDSIIVNLQKDGRVKFTSSSSGIESFIENTNEDPRQEHMFLLALGNIDGVDATKLASFLKKHNKVHIYNYLAKNRPNLKLKRISVVSQKKDNEEKKEVEIKETKGRSPWHKRFFKKKLDALSHASPIEKEVKSQRKWYKDYKSFFLKKGGVIKHLNYPRCTEACR